MESMKGWFESPPLEVYVGSQSQSFWIHAALVECISKPLYAFINTKYHIQGYACLNNVTTEVFQALCEHMYYGQYTTPTYVAPPASESGSSSISSSNTPEPCSEGSKVDIYTTIPTTNKRKRANTRSPLIRAEKYIKLKELQPSSRLMVIISVRPSGTIRAVVERELLSGPVKEQLERCEEESTRLAANNPHQPSRKRWAVQLLKFMTILKEYETKTVPGSEEIRPCLLPRGDQEKPISFIEMSKSTPWTTEKDNKLGQHFASIRDEENAKESKPSDNTQDTNKRADSETNNVLTDSSNPSSNDDPNTEISTKTPSSRLQKAFQNQTFAINGAITVTENPNFLFHTQVHVFATRFQIRSLCLQALKSLHTNLWDFKLDERNSHRILDLLEFVYANTKRPESEGQSSELRDLVILYVASRVTCLAKNLKFSVVLDGHAHIGSDLALKLASD